MLPCLSGS